jgi:O-antigen biosynthesis protein WbqP
MIKRCFDIVFAFILLILLSPILLLVGILIILTDRRPVLFWSSRVGRDNVMFLMPKFRSMRINAPVVATHQLNDPAQWLTPIGSFLRRLSLDELPQLWSILKGDMSFVGPRPALFNQQDLIDVRTQRNIHKLRPGLTGWAQVNGRDEIPLALKLAYDEYYLINQSFWLDLKILWLTIHRVLQSDGVSH